jgi:hypothetical protein
MTGPSLPALSQALLHRLRDRIPENIPANLLAHIEFSTAKILNAPQTISRLARQRSSRASWKTLCNWRISPATRWAGLSRFSASQTVARLLFSDRTSVAEGSPVFSGKRKIASLLIDGIAGVMAWF